MKPSKIGNEIQFFEKSIYVKKKFGEIPESGL